MISRAHLHCAAAAARWSVLGAAALGSACSPMAERPQGEFLGFIRPYRIEVVQGNVVTREQAAILRPGMTRQQVRDILGSPMLTDPFHADRWDYVFTIRRQGTEPQRRSIVAHFKGNALERIDVPDNLPSESEFVASIAPYQGSGGSRVLELTPEQRSALPVPPKPESVTAQAPPGPTRKYPPLESQ